jgi:hypothetical protein
VTLNDEGRFRITLSRDVEDSEEGQSIRVDDQLKRGIVELRITLLDVDRPVILPGVYQNGVRLVEGEEV